MSLSLRGATRWPVVLFNGTPLVIFTSQHCTFGSRSKAAGYLSCRRFSVVAEVVAENAEAPKTPELIDVNPPRGTRDFLPPQMRRRNWLFSHFREVSRLFGFEEVDFPIVESEFLFTRKSGEEITQQLYNFEDKSGRRLALRPELTPSIARLILKRGEHAKFSNLEQNPVVNVVRKSLNFPVRWFTIGQCWRYERSTRGRKREHYQWNMDLLGIPVVEAEAELLSAIVTFFKRVGLTADDVKIKFSNRKLLQDILNRNGVPEEKFARVCVVVDKREKLPREEIEKQLRDLGLSSSAIDGILHAVSIQTLDDLEELLGSTSEAFIELSRLYKLSASYGYQEWMKFDASIVRGLSYYTGTVFEAFDTKQQFRAICGGGRYDKLVPMFGGLDVPACGFGFGDAVILELLQDKSLIPQIDHEVDDVIFVLDEELRPYACAIASRLRELNHSVEHIMENKRLKWALNHADQMHAKRLIMVGKREWNEGSVRVKNMVTKEEIDMDLDDLMERSEVPADDDDDESSENEVEEGAKVKMKKERNLRYLYYDQMIQVNMYGSYPEEYENGFPTREILNYYIEECKKRFSKFKRKYHDCNPAAGSLKYLLRALNVKYDLDELISFEAEKIWNEESDGISVGEAYALVHDHNLPISQVVKMNEDEGRKKLAELENKSARPSAGKYRPPSSLTSSSSSSSSSSDTD